MATWLRRLLSQLSKPTPEKTRRRRARLALEALEDRLTPTNHSPLTPVITEPIADGAVLNGSDVHMVIAPFQDQDIGDVESAADWQIWTTGVNAQVVWQDLGVTDTLRLTRDFYAYGQFLNGLAGKQELDFDTNYQLRVRVADSSGDAATQWSPWSLRNFKTTPALQPTPGVGTWAIDQPGYKVEQVASGLQLAVDIAFVPNPGQLPSDPSFYVTELYGTIAMVERNGTVVNYATGLLNFNPTGAFPGSGEQGLAGVCVDPASGDLFATVVYDSGGVHYPKVIRLHSNDGGHTAATVTTVLAMPNDPVGQSHQISNITIGPDGKLWVHVGDAFVDGLGQNLTSFRGKVLRMNFDGTAASDNPFYDPSDGITARDYVFSYGYRNPFGGAWRTDDNSHFVIENGPSVDRLSKAVAGRNMLFDGSDASMRNFATYNWGPPAHAPVNGAFIQTSDFNGSRFPASKLDHLFVSESGPTFAAGPITNGKQISEFIIDSNGNLVSGPTRLIHYNGTGNSTVVGLAAGPDGLYFTDLYAETGGPTQFAAHVYRVKYIGTAAPVAPATLSATAVSQSRINLTWTDSSDNEDGFRIERSTDGVNFTEIGSAAANVTSFDVVSLQGNTTYFFRVRPFSNDLGNGGYSPAASSQTLSSSSIPAAPASLTAQATSNTQVTLAWQNNSNNEDGFYIELSLNATTGFVRVGTAPAGTTTYDISGLQFGTAYYFRVQAFNSAGISGNSNVASVTTLARLPGTPTGLTATASANQIGLSWQASTDAVSYNVYRGTSPGGENAAPLATGVTTTFFADTTVSAGITYYYKIRAVNPVGVGDPSLEASAATGQPSFVAHVNFQPATVPVPAGYVVDSGAVYGARGNGLTYGWNVDVSGDTRDRNEPASPDQRYDTLVHVANTVFWELAVPNGQYTVHIVSGDPGYLDSVHKLNVEGTLAINFTPTAATLWQEATLTVTVNDGKLTISPASGAINDKINFIDVTSAAPATPPPAPTGLTATAGVGQVALGWSLVTGATSYNVYRGTSPNGESATPIATGLTAGSYTDAGLTVGVTYYYKVSGVNSTGEGPLSGEASAIPTAPPPAPTAPTGLTATPGTGLVALSWSLVTGATSYKIYRGTTPNGESATPIATGLSAGTFTDTGLAAATTYYYKVSAANGTGEGPLSTEASATTAATPAFAAKINFATALAPVPTGYMADTGTAYGSRGSGLTFGWSGNNTASTRDRNDPLSPDQRYDTLIHMNGQVWEIAVPNGTYTVHIVAGDTDYLNSVEKINVEGTLAVNFTPTASALWQEATVTVNVTDGRLTVAAATGAVNPKLNYIDIVSGGTAGPPVTPAVTNSVAAATADTNAVWTLWLQHLYRNMLGREIISDEIKTWLGYKAKNGTMAACANAILVSTEHKNFVSTTTVQDVYQTYLKRNATPAELNTWVPGLTAGTTNKDAVVSSVILGTDYSARVGASNSQFIAGLYTDMLGRTAQQSDIDAWLNVMSKGATRPQVVAAILATTEYKTRQNVLWAGQLYNVCLGRFASAAEVNSTLSLLAGGSTFDSVAAKILVSQEYIGQVTD